LFPVSVNKKSAQFNLTGQPAPDQAAGAMRKSAPLQRQLNDVLAVNGPGGFFLRGRFRGYGKVKWQTLQL
jgi:hypothetical protein